jgi:hypothetical protein
VEQLQAKYKCSEQPHAETWTFFLTAPAFASMPVKEYQTEPLGKQIRVYHGEATNIQAQARKVNWPKFCNSNYKKESRTNLVHR